MLKFFCDSTSTTFVVKSTPQVEFVKDRHLLCNLLNYARFPVRLYSLFSDTTIISK